MATKSKILSIRLSEYEYDKLVHEAEEAGYANTGAYAREKLFERKQSNRYYDDNYKKQQNFKQWNRDKYMRINKELIKMQHEIENIPNTTGKENLKKEVFAVWQLLN